MHTRRKIIRSVLFGALIASFILGSFELTEFIATSPSSQAVVLEYGRLGVLLLGFIAGLNILLPVPAATFVPVFSTSGIDTLSIIILLVIGTMVANLLSYLVGRYGHTISRSHYPDLAARLGSLYERKRAYVPYFIFAFTALVPLPDEVFLIPLGLIGVRLQSIIIPLFLGTIVYQTLTVLGFTNLFSLLSANF